MIRCPTCGAACADEDLFCESDGTPLAARLPGGDASGPAAPTRPSAPPAKAGAACSSCGALGTDDGDGYCSACGHRLKLAGHPSSAAPSSRGHHETLSSGAVVGGFTLASLDGEEATGLAPDGVEVLLVFGDDPALALEAEALERLAPAPGFPRLSAHRGGRTGDGTPFLALIAPPPAARPLAEVARTGTPAEAVRLIEALLELAAAVERAGFAFEPTARDVLVMPDGSLVLRRLRGAERLTYGPRLDAKAILESVAEAFLPMPAVHGPARLVRLLTSHREASAPPRRTLPVCLAELEAVRAELATPLGAADLAAECDAGLWRPYNQDATALAHGVNGSDPWVVLVVCDGVSSSARAEEASAVAAKTTCDALAHFASAPDITHETATSAVAAAIRAAHLAICADNAARASSTDLPGTTIAAALVYRRRLTVGWVGDSRGYWIAPKGAELLTLDHSWVNEALARGEIKQADEVTGPLAHTITRCLGPLEVGEVPTEVEPDVRSRDLPGPGIVMLCSDGLWNYVADPADLHAMVGTAGPSAASVARVLTNYALARGGQDNVSVAAYIHV